MALKPSRFLDPKSDIVFKKIFGNHPELLISFLNGIMPFQEGGFIESLSYLPTEQTPRIPSLKNTIVDVKCTDQSGRVFIIEMQMSWTASFTKRLLFGASKAYVQQLNSGEDYASLCPVYGLGIINEIFDRNSNEWLHHYRTVNVQDTSKVLEGLELVFLELPKFRPETLHHRKMGVLWLRFLREINEKLVDVPQEFMDCPELNKAMELSQEAAYTTGELETYDKYWDAVRVEQTLKTDAFTQGKSQGIEIGKYEGIAIGKSEGIAIGKSEGIAIGESRGVEIATLNIAKTMLAEGLSLQKVIEMTKLSAEQATELSSILEPKDPVY